MSNTLQTKCPPKEREGEREKHEIPYSGYILSKFNFILSVLIPCGTNIIQRKKAFLNATYTKWQLRMVQKYVIFSRMKIYSDETYLLYFYIDINVITIIIIIIIIILVVVVV